MNDYICYECENRYNEEDYPVQLSNGIWVQICKTCHEEFKQ